MSCQCQECKTQYKIDLLVPEELWKKINKGRNLLCGSCIMKELEALDRYNYFFLSKEGDK